MSRTELRIGGLGGQGVILCGMIIGRAASIYGGKHATLIQSFGPEARGSACSAQVIISDEQIGYPYLRRPNLLVMMSLDAFAKFVPELQPGGLVMYESELITPSAGLPPGVRAVGIPATRIATELGRRMVMNIVMTGFFAGVTGLVPYDAVEKAVTDSVPAGTQELNLYALRKGFEFGAGIPQPEAARPS
jgi:2-oxoglutarate ferredoxin oxidoreductase subunit gamma